MRRHDLDVEGKAVGGAAAAGGAARTGATRKTRRRWSVEEKLRIARESFASSESVAAVAERHAITRRQLWSWRTQLRRGKLVAGSSTDAEPPGAFAAVEVEARHSVVIEGRGVTVRVDGVIDTGGIASIAVALAGSR